MVFHNVKGHPGASVAIGADPAIKVLSCLEPPTRPLGFNELSIASFPTMGMVVVPCSMKTVAGIVSGCSDNLLMRVADMCLKERRKQLLCARESPLSAVYLRNLYEASKLETVILPPVPAYYVHPQAVADCTRYTVQRILIQFGQGRDGYPWEDVE